MKFVCEQCLSKYTIADEKVRGKILKIRCVKCGNLIEVRDAAAATKSSSTSLKSLPPPPPPEALKASPLENRFASSFKAPAQRPSSPAKPVGTPGLLEEVQKSARKLERDDTAAAIWFTAIDNAPVGPITARAVDEHRKAGKVDDSSLVWREGMADWIPLTTCKELVGLLAHIEIENTTAARKAVPRPAPRLGLFAGEAPSGLPPVDSPLRGKSVGVPTDHEGAAAPEPPKPAAKSAEDHFFGADGPRASLPSMPPPRPASLDKWVKLAAIGFFGIAVIVLCVILFAGGDKEPKVIEKVVEKIVEKERVVYRDRGVVQTEGAAAETDSDKAARKAVRLGVKPKDASAPTTADEQKRRLLEQLGAAGPGADPALVGGGTSGRTTGAGASGAAPVAAGQGLSDKELSAVVGKNKGALQTCYEQSMKKGETPDAMDLKILVDLTVGGSGMVKRASVSGPGARYAGLKGCIESAAKKWIFPEKPAESSAQFPFLFTPK
jgi:predicted Zn finger-like uncharacterized protein